MCGCQNIYTLLMVIICGVKHQLDVNIINSRLLSSIVITELTVPYCGVCVEHFSIGIKIKY